MAINRINTPGSWEATHESLSVCYTSDLIKAMVLFIMAGGARRVTHNYEVMRIALLGTGDPRQHKAVNSLVESWYPRFNALAEYAAISPRACKRLCQLYVEEARRLFPAEWAAGRRVQEVGVESN